MTHDVRRVPDPSLQARVAVSLVIALLSALVVMYDRIAAPETVPDFDQVWFAATAILQGRDPYTLIGPGREFAVDFEFYYPLTAPLIVLPLGLLPLMAARVLYIAVPSGLLAFQLTRYGYARLAFFASGVFLSCVKTLQWTPWIACSLLIPWLGFFIAAKPNIGLCAIAGAPSKRHLHFMLGGAAVVAAGSVLVQPPWPIGWRDAVATAHHFRSFIAIPGGVILLLALLRWRQWEARLLLMLAVVPQTLGLPATLMVMLFPRSFRALLLLGILSYAPLFLTVMPPDPSFPDFTFRVGRMTLWFVLVPALVLVLRRPNHGPAPAVIERVVAGWPHWLRGVAGAPTDPRTMDA